jgi:hypothetical protein
VPCVLEEEEKERRRTTRMELSGGIWKELCFVSLLLRFEREKSHKARIKV